MSEHKPTPEQTHEQTSGPGKVTSNPQMQSVAPPPFNLSSSGQPPIQCWEDPGAGEGKWMPSTKKGNGPAHTTGGGEASAPEKKKNPVSESVPADIQVHFNPGNPEAWHLFMTKSNKDTAKGKAIRKYIKTKLAGFTIPTKSGKMVDYKGGLAYQSKSHRNMNDQSKKHHEFLEGYKKKGMKDARLQRLIPEIKTSNRYRILWGMFNQIILPQEGDTSAINAWDDQIVTYGAGYSAKGVAAKPGKDKGDGLDAGRIFNKMPQEFRQRLYEAGIYVNPNHTLTILSHISGTLKHGNSALKIMADYYPGMFGAYIEQAQSDEKVPEKGQTKGEDNFEMREHMLKAQFIRFVERNADMPDSVLGWDFEKIAYAIKLKHWSGALSWSRLASSGGSIEKIKKVAFDTVALIYKKKAKKKELEAEGKMNKSEIKSALKKVKLVPADASKYPKLTKKINDIKGRTFDKASKLTAPELLEETPKGDTEKQDQEPTVGNYPMGSGLMYGPSEF